MQISPAQIPDVIIIEPDRHGDERGVLSETYNRRDLEAVGVALDFVQDNHVLSRDKGVLRGLHFQLPPFAQAKLVRVVRGSIFDVAVDLRRGSATFGHHAAAVLSAANWRQVLIPVGFAHGYCTLEPDTQVLYKVTDYYAPEYERGLAWDDPALAIPWPLGRDEVVVSERDRALPPLEALETAF